MINIFSSIPNRYEKFNNFLLITQLSHYQGPVMEKAMAPHSSTLAWRIPGMGEPGGLSSMGLHRVGHDCSDLVVVVRPCQV